MKDDLALAECEQTSVALGGALTFGEALRMLSDSKTRYTRARKRRSPLSVRSRCIGTVFLAEARIGQFLEKAQACGMLIELPNGNVTVPVWFRLDAKKPKDE